MPSDSRSDPWVCASGRASTAHDRVRHCERPGFGLVPTHVVPHVRRSRRSALGSPSLPPRLGAERTSLQRSMTPRPRRLPSSAQHALRSEQRERPSISGSPRSPASAHGGDAATSRSIQSRTSMVFSSRGLARLGGRPQARSRRRAPASLGQFQFDSPMNAQRKPPPPLAFARSPQRR
jgi:hypothetical protein